MLGRIGPRAVLVAALLAAGFSCAAVLAVAAGFMYTRRGRLRAARAARAGRSECSESERV